MIFAVLWTFCVFKALAFEEYQALVPNGGAISVNGVAWPGLGHENPVGSGPRNPFGQDFAENGRSWAEICELDSDGDGISNGFELGDEECLWASTADNGILRNTDLTHPGVDNDDTGEVNTGPTVELKWHVTTMCLAWLFFAPLGIAAAAYFKVQTKAKQKVLYIHWYKFHKFCLGTTVYLTLLSYAIMIRYRDGFITANDHTKIGHVVVALAVFQPVNGLYRVHLKADGSKSLLRLTWEYLHQWLGRILLIIAFANTYIGFNEYGFLFSSGVENGMRVITITLLVVLGISSALWAILRKDHRNDPPLPTKKEEKVEKKPEEKKEEPPVTETATEEEEAEPKNVEGAPKQAAETPGKMAEKKS